jgi:hypothetical protein
MNAVARKLDSGAGVWLIFLVAIVLALLALPALGELAVPKGMSPISYESSAVLVMLASLPKYLVLALVATPFIKKPGGLASYITLVLASMAIDLAIYWRLALDQTTTVGGWIGLIYAAGEMILWFIVPMAFLLIRSLYKTNQPQEIPHERHHLPNRHR